MCTVLLRYLDFCMHQQQRFQTFFVLYHIFILLPHYLCQLNFSVCSSDQDTDAVAIIAIIFPLHWVVHRRFHSLYCILHPIHRGGAAYFVICLSSGYGDGAFFLSQPLMFRWGWDTTVILYSLLPPFFT